MHRTKLVLPLLVAPMLFACGGRNTIGKFKFSKYEIIYEDGKDDYTQFVSCQVIPKNEEELLEKVKTNLITISSQQIQTKDKCIHFDSIDDLTNECVDTEGNPVTDVGEVNHMDVSDTEVALTCNYGKAKNVYHLYDIKRNAANSDMKITFEIFKIAGTHEVITSTYYDYEVKDEELKFDDKNLTIVTRVLYHMEDEGESDELINAKLILIYSRI